MEKRGRTKALQAGRQNALRNVDGRESREREEVCYNTRGVMEFSVIFHLQ